MSPYNYITMHDTTHTPTGGTDAPSRTRESGLITVFRAASCIILAAVLVFETSCLHKSPIRRETLHRDMDRISSSLERNAGNLAALKDRRFGATGYVYAFDRDGIVTYHPQSALAGMSFEGNPAVRRMLEMKSGCLVQHLEGRDRMMVFRPAGNGGIVCLTIALDEVEGGATGCVELK